MEMKFNYKSFFAGILAVLMVYLYVCVIFIPKNASDAAGTHFFSGKGFIGENVENSTDVLVIGNSDVYCGFSPCRMFEKTGITSYASGVALQNIDGVNAIFSEALKTQKPKVAVLDVDCLYTTSSVSSRLSGSLLCSPVMYHFRWKSLHSYDFYTYPTKQAYYDSAKGYVFSDVTMKVDGSKYMSDKGKRYDEISAAALRGLNEFINTCRENGVKILLTELPSVSSWSLAKSNYISSLAAKNGVRFVDMNLPSSGYTINFDSDFRDCGDHLNVYGAERATDYLTGVLSEMYGNLLGDKRSNTDVAASWRKSCADYNKQRSSSDKKLLSA